MPSISQVLAVAARRQPHADALVDGDERLDYAELDARVNQVAHALAGRGIAHGDRVLLMSGNSGDFITAYFGVLRLGAIVVPVNPASAPGEVAYLAEDSGASIMLIDGASASPAVLAALPELRAGVLALRPHATEADLAALADAAPPHAPDVEVAESDDALILYTSGTTGQPKGVLLDHHRVVWVGVNTMLITGMREHARILHTAPLYHAAQLTMMLSTASMLNAVHVVARKFEPTAVLDLLERERITLFFGVPTMYQLMLAEPSFAERDLSAWRTGVFGAAPMPGAVVDALLEACPGVEMIQACGQTEGGPGGIYATASEVRDKPSASGRFGLPNTESRVLDEDGHDVAADAVGELVLRGETVMKRYWKRPTETEEAMHNGWLRTGDMAHVDAQGYVTLVDRKKDMIITGGRNVYSVEIENALAGHRELADCAVVGVPNETWGESIVAFVVPRQVEAPSLEALHAHLSPHVSRYKMPHQVLAVDAIPRNASGKILKHVLRQQLAEDAETVAAS